MYNKCCSLVLVADASIVEYTIKTRWILMTMKACQPQVQFIHTWLLERRPAFWSTVLCIPLTV